MPLYNLPFYVGDKKLDSQIHQNWKEGDLKSYSTNNILIEFDKGKHSKPILYLPGYMSFKIKNITEIDLENLSGSVNGTLLFSFYYGDL